MIDNVTVVRRTFDSDLEHDASFVTLFSGKYARALIKST